MHVTGASLCTNTFLICFPRVVSVKNGREERKSVSQRKQNEKMDLPQAQCRASAITSAKLGVGPSTPTEALPSSNEVANARAAAQPNMALHLRVHADRARPRNKSETPVTSSHARPRRPRRRPRACFLAWPSSKTPRPGRRRFASSLQADVNG